MKFRFLLVAGCLNLSGCFANASTPPSQETIERAVRSVEAVDQFQQRRGVTLIDHQGNQWWAAIAGSSDKRLQSESLIRTRLTHLVRSSIALVALKDDPYCAEFQDLMVTPVRKVDGYWVVYAVVRADNVRKGSSCTQSIPNKSIESEEMEDPLDIVKSEEISFP
jgi:hypothetical protein